MNVVLLANMRGEQDKGVCPTQKKRRKSTISWPTPHPNPNCNTEQLLTTVVHCTVFNALTNVTVDGFQMSTKCPTSGGQARDQEAGVQ